MMVDKSRVGPQSEGASGAAVVSEAKGESADDSGSDDGLIQQQGNPSQSGQRTKSNQRWMKLRTTVQLSGAITSSIQKTKPTLKREDSFLKRFSTRQVPETQETMDTGDDGESHSGTTEYLRRYKKHSRHKTHPRTVVNPDEDFYFYWLLVVSACVLYNLWTLIVRQSFPELQYVISYSWFLCDMFTDFIYLMDIIVQVRTGYLEQGLMVYDSRKLAGHYIKSSSFLLDLGSLLPLDLLQLNFGVNPMLRFPRFLKVYRVYDYYYMVESRTVYPNLWRVLNLIHILLILAHWFGCFYYLLSEAEDFQGDWVYPYRAGDYATLTRKYLGSLYWSTLTLTTIGDLPSPETNADKSSTDGFQYRATRGHKSRLLRIKSTKGYVFTIVSYLIGVFIFATIVGQVGNVITNRNANRLEFERLLDGAKTYMRHHKVPGGMKRRVLRWYDYSWSRGRIQGGGDINTALGLLPDKLKTELALHVNLSVLKKVTIFHECQPEFLHDLVLKMKAYIFTPGDLICRKGEVAREMFIIADGILEVKSETGRILTTMKAGDFFGEIGILNLDGLNKRTADVRSVGYSELFSLSREDVLAAMKDYPEAEEILQTLGRKRLMDAARIMKGTKPGGTESGKNTSSTSPEFFDHLTGKRIVQKIRSDVKGLKNVLRKSRRRARSKDDSLELQPLTEVYASGPSSGKGILRRMSRVWSDDTSQEDEVSPPESKIGAGLPLLQRIKLLDEKNKKDVEGRKATSFQAPVTVRKEEPEVIGAGLPLLKRLLLLKQKEDNETALVQKTVNETAEILVSTVRTQHKSPPSSFSRSRKLTEDDDIELKPCMSTMKVKSSITSGKNETVSWKVSDEHDRNNETDSVKESSNSCDEENIVKEKHLKPGIKKVFGKSAGKSTWSAIKKATMVQKIDKKAETSRIKTNLSENTNIQSCTSISAQKVETSHMKLKEEERPVTMDVDDISENMERLHTYQELSKNNLMQSKHNDSELNRQNIEKQESDMLQLDDVDLVRANSARADEFKVYEKNSDADNFRVKVSNNNELIITKSPTISSCDGNEWNTRNAHKIKPSLKRIHKESKIYSSTGDLSPEYSGLPFEKRLKILNQRQKKANMENYYSIRSSSLDSGIDIYSREISNLSYSFKQSRCDSETIAIEFMLRKQLHQVDQLLETQFPKVPNENVSTSLSSPESNETAERLNLKSILKKLSSGSLVSYLDDPTSQQSLESLKNVDIKPSSTEMRKLMRAQTIEGYVARHSKLTKSVTFNRDTLPSPPKVASSFDFSCSNFSSGSQELRYKKTDMTQNSRSLDLNTTRNSEPLPLFKGSMSDEFSFQTRKPDKTTPSNQQYITQDEYQSLHNLTNKVKPSASQKKTSFTNWIEPPESKQKNFFRPGSILLPFQNSQDDECFGGVLGGVKFLIQQHLEEVHGRFSQRFLDLEIEVKKRDDIISQLQEHIRELEHQLNEDAQSSKSDDADPPFMRGASIETIIDSPAPRERRYSLSYRRSWEDQSEEESLELMELPRSMTPQPILEYTAIDIGSESSRSENGTDFESLNKTNPDWEVEQLAEEFNRRESLKRSHKREILLSSKHKSVFPHRRAISFDTVSPNSGWKARSLDYPEAESSGEVFRRTLFP